jgi:DNA mismatch endonuclease Vsr
MLPSGRFLDVPESRSRTMAAIRGKNTRSTEIALRMALVRSKLSGWRLHAAELLGKPDVIFPNERVVVFVDGCFWHGCKDCGHIPKTRSSFWSAKIMRNKLRDRKATRRLRQQGLKVIRIWEHSLDDPITARKAIRKITVALGRVRDSHQC